MSADELPADEFPGLYVRHLTDSITWRFYKHWAQCYAAGEGLTERQGDRSGCLLVVNGMKLTSAPRVAQARLYESAKGWISAVYSYPNGIGLMDTYFWEIYSPDLFLDGPERFATEREMEQRVQELLS